MLYSLTFALGSSLKLICHKPMLFAIFASFLNSSISSFAVFKFVLNVKLVQKQLIKRFYVLLLINDSGKSIYLVIFPMVALLSAVLYEIVLFIDPSLTKR